jgi:hypothetical protein
MGTEAVLRLHPAESHVPAKAAQVVMAAWSQPHEGPWPAPPGPRPLIMFRPEPVDAPETPEIPARFRWRRREFAVRMAAGPGTVAAGMVVRRPRLARRDAGLLAGRGGRGDAALAVLWPGRGGGRPVVLRGGLCLT